MLRPEAAERFESRDGVLFPAGGAAPTPYRRQWEAEAEEDHVVSAIARRAPDETLDQLTAKLTPVWARIDIGTHFDTILDIGCGYGRVELHLSAMRDVMCRTFVGVDISEGMLRHFRRYRDRFGVFPGADVLLLCTSAESLPLEDDSVDLVVSSAVFLHMGRRYVEATLGEIARVLRPGGDIVFESSFPNRSSPANVVSRAAGLLGERRPNQVKLYDYATVARLIEASGLAGKLGKPYGIEASERALLPKAVAGRGVPFARRLNAYATEKEVGSDRRLGVTFTVTSLAPR